MTTTPDHPTPDSSASPAGAGGPTLPPPETIENPGAWSVPIAVWRLAPRPTPVIPDQAPDTKPGVSGDPTDPTPRPHESRARPQPDPDDDRFVSRLAHWLVLTLAHPGETVVDLDDSATLHDAAQATGRNYLPLTDPTRVADLDALDHPIGLILFRWPRHPDPSTRPPGTPPTTTASTTTTSTTSTLASREREPLSTAVRDLFLACRVMSTADTCVVAAIHPTTQFSDHERTLRSAAEAVGLRHIMTILALPAPGDSDEFLYYATPSESNRLHPPDPDATPDPEGDPGWHIDLLLFTPPTPPSSPPTMTDGTTAPDPAPGRRPLTGDHD